MEFKQKYVPKDVNTWLKKIADYYTSSGGHASSSISNDVRNFKKMAENYEIMIGNLDNDQLNKALNPMGLKQAKMDLEVNEQTIPVILPSVNTLIGEIYDRNIDFRAYIMNTDAISEKEVAIKKEFGSRLAAILDKKEKGMSEEEFQLEMNKIKQWQTYEAQDVRERVANHIIKDSIERYKFQQVTKNGWKDMIANSNEIYKFAIESGNVVFKHIHPTDISIFGLPDNGNIHESEAIIHNRYLTYSEVIASYNLKKSEIDKILKETGGEGDSTADLLIFAKEDSFDDNDEGMHYDSINNKFITKNDDNGVRGNKVLVRTVYFKALRKVYKLHSIHPESGEEIITMIAGSYKAKKEEGEWTETEYYPEYWQVTKILTDIYTDMKACDVQMRDMNNPKIVKAPIVGKVMMTGKKVSTSIIDVLKPIQYKWTVFSKKVSMLWSRNLGQLVKIDISKIPKKYGFDLDLFMSWITTFGIILEDPFNEGMKGQPSGQYTSSVSSVNLELSSSIQTALQYMIYLRELADETVGVTRQRRGELMASDGLGTTQESISRSLNITEELFQEHHEIQKELLQYILEYNKETIRTGDNKKIQYITDDMSYHIYDIDKDNFLDVDMGIFINNSKKQFEMDQMFTQLAHAAMQNGTMTMSEVMGLMNNYSMADKINKLKNAEQEQNLREKEAQEKQQQYAMEQQEAIKILRQEEMAHEIALQQMKNDADIKVAEIQAGVKLEVENIKSEQNDKDNDIKKEVEKDKALYNYTKQKTNK